MQLLFTFLDSPRFPAAGRPPCGEDEQAIQNLVIAARNGNTAAARALYQHFVQRVFRTVRPLCPTEADAEDITQDTFIKAFGALKRYEQRKNKRFVAWLMTIALNTARKRCHHFNRLRALTEGTLNVAANQWSRAGRAGPPDPSDQRAPSGSFGPLAPTGPPHPSDRPDENLARAETKQILLTALAELSDRDRRVVTLRYGADLKAGEVAALLGLQTATVRKIAQRGRQRLRARLQQFENNDVPDSRGNLNNAGAVPPPHPRGTP